MNLPTPPDAVVPADQISGLTPSQVLADARAAGARPEHVLDATAVAIAGVLGSDASFYDLLSDAAQHVHGHARDWLAEHYRIEPNAEIDYARDLTDVQVAGMLDHVADLARRYDRYDRYDR
ncbi:hypothetical protein ACU635_44045 [[Actinomadura] parvosata]|uniref:hypothetical protein n=1 Tax=[Actinomadura] parvosata TaxID=1955412 RepID=UPI00406C0067